jgi:EmrB/QacA subfamily drug resistance transporter
MTANDDGSNLNRSGAHSRRVALIVAVAWFMQNLDTFIIVTSLPQIARTFGTPTIDVNIGITAHVVAGAAFIPLGGWLADRYGGRRVFSTAIILFGVASIGCAASSTLWQFVLARVVQGIGGAFMVPVGRALVLRNTDKANLMRATALITWPGLIAPVVAPVLGGALTTWLGWPAIFLVNVPIVVIAVVLVLVFIPRTDDYSSKPFDVIGTVLLVLALGLSIYGLSDLSRRSAPSVALACLLTGFILGALAVWWFRRSPHPLIDLAPLRVATFAMATLTGGHIVRVAISATPFLLPLMLQEAWGLTPIEAGNAVLVYALGNLLMKTVTTALLRAFGFRNVAVGNGLVVAGSIVTLGVLTVDTRVWIVWAAAFVAGASRSIEFTAINTLAFADVEPEHRTTASTVFSMMQQAAMAIGVALAALALSAQSNGSGDLSQTDFLAAFTGAGAVALGGALLMLRLASDAGQQVTGHRPRSLRGQI